MSTVLADLKGGLSKQTMREQISQRLVDMVRAGLLRPGDELPGERELATTLGVSRETVRGGVQSLATLGVIEVVHGARSRVAEAALRRLPPDPARDLAPSLAQYTADEVYQARRLVELAVAREAVGRLTEAQLERMRQLVRDQSAMFDDPVSFQISDLEFHVTIYRAGGGRLVAAFLGSVYDYALEYRRRALLVPGAVRRSWQDHRHILDALERRDGEAAAAAMARHLLRVHRTTLAVQKRG